MSETLEKRTWVYRQRPIEYDIAGCKCGNTNPDWSEYKNHLWCATCKIDFKPEHHGIFDGPIPAALAIMLDYNFERYNLITKQIEPFEFGQEENK